MHEVVGFKYRSLHAYFWQALSEVLPAIAAKQIEKGGYIILRPDSGDPLDAVLAALRAAEKVFGADVNKKGYKVPRGCGVIQGDGIDYNSLKRLLDGIIDAGYSIEVSLEARQCDLCWQAAVESNILIHNLSKAARTQA